MAQDTRDQWEEKNADKMLRFQWQVDPIKLDCTKTTADDKVTPVAINLCSLSKVKNNLAVTKPRKSVRSSEPKTARGTPNGFSKPSTLRQRQYNDLKQEFL